MSGGERTRLLIVDDEVPQLQALCDILAQEGYEPRGFNGAQQALTQLAPGQYELLMTDLMMPGMDGIALIQAAQQIDPWLGAVVMTGHGTIDTAVQAMQAGALDYILKPFNLKIARPVLARALDVQRLRRGNALLREREQQHLAELAAAYRDLEAFAYSISHDLRAPLRAIEGFAQMLEEQCNERLGVEGRRITRVIRDNSRTMDQLIVGLLEFSRAGRQPLTSASIDMKALAKAALAEAMTGYQGPEPRVHIEDLPRCPGDATVLRQVWANLIGNALKYSAKRQQPEVRISGRLEEPDAIYQIQDNGAGFDMRYASKLFGVFQRLHAAQEFSGTGVGLAIVQRIIARHGGRIWAQAQPNAGACFQFALPLVAPSKQAAEQAASDAPQSAVSAGAAMKGA